MPKQFDLVVFDWDGTLMDSTPAITRSIQLSCADLGLPVPSDEQASYVIGLGLHDALAHAVPALQPAQLPDMLERYRHHYLVQEAALTLFPEVQELLSDLRERGHYLAVATGKSRAGLDRALRTTGLGPLFDATRCADETRSKPDPAMLFELLERFDADPARTVMIGDTTHDLLMARQARMPAIGVTYGAHPVASLRALEPLACVDSVPVLRSWLRQHA